MNLDEAKLKENQLIKQVIKLLSVSKVYRIEKKKGFFSFLKK